MFTSPFQILESLFNMGSQAEERRYQRELQERIFEREDTAVRRRVADLKAAGLSPVLAAGNGAGAGTPLAQTGVSSNVVGSFLDAMSAIESNKTQKKQQKLLTQQAKNLEDENERAWEDWFQTRFMRGVIMGNDMSFIPLQGIPHSSSFGIGPASFSSSGSQGLNFEFGSGAGKGNSGNISVDPRSYRPDFYKPVRIFY